MKVRKPGNEALKRVYGTTGGWRIEMAKWFAARCGYEYRYRNPDKPGQGIFHIETGLCLTSHSWIEFYTLFKRRIWDEYERFTGETAGLAAIGVGESAHSHHERSPVKDGMGTDGVV